jgi:hypothetical protein
MSRQCGILNISQPYRPSRPVTGMALLFFTFYYKTKNNENSDSPFISYIYIYVCVCVCVYIYIYKKVKLSPQHAVEAYRVVRC